MGSSFILPQPGQPVEGPDPNFRSLSVAPAISFRRTDLDPPSPLYVSADELVIIQCMNSVVGAALFVEMRVLFPDGRLSRMESRFTITSDRTNNAFEIPMQECFLLSVTFAATGAVVRRGQFFVTANLEVGRVGKGTFQYQLYAGYLMQATVAGWPTSTPIDSVQGAGMILSVQNAAPAAGADFVITVPTGARWRVRTMNLTLTASATVANRQVEFAVQDNLARNVYIVSSPVNQTAGTTDTYCMSDAPTQVSIIPTVVQMPFPPDMFLFQGWRIVSSTANLQVGDQFSAQQLSLEEWIEL